MCGAFGVHMRCHAVPCGTHAVCIHGGHRQGSRGVERNGMAWNGRRMSQPQGRAAISRLGPRCSPEPRVPVLEGPTRPYAAWPTLRHGPTLRFPLPEAQAQQRRRLRADSLGGCAEGGRP